MKKGMTQIVFIIDRSGSMGAMVNEAIGGFNAFVEDQKKVPGEASMTLVQFDHEYEVVFSDKPIKDVQPLSTMSYVPRGTTALLDAVGKTINDVGRTLSGKSEDDRPEHVIFVILTDGMENASKEFSNEKIKDLIKHQEEKYSWHFRYLAAGVDAYAAVMNIASQPDAQVMSFAADGEHLTKGLVQSSCCVRNLRTSGDSTGWNH